MSDFASLMASWPWVAIPHCPGRFVLKAHREDLLPSLSAAAAGATREFRVAACRDPVRVTPLEDGGLISYRQADGGYTHTLNTPEGFARKLAQLGIALDSTSNRA